MNNKTEHIQLSHQADIDLDFGNRDDILSLIRHTPAMFTKGDLPSKHNSGVYVQPIPVDPTTGISSIHFKEADSRGYFKLDFLNMHVYNLIKSPAHYATLLDTPPPWHRLNESEFTNQIVHIANYHNLLVEMMPNSIAQMAMFLAVIRPAKKHLQKESWKSMSETLWDKPENNEYYFKKSHAIAYATLVSLHMTIINNSK